jgi:UPF0755 protein
MSQLGIGMTDVSHDEMHRERQSNRAVAIAGVVVVALLAVTTIFVVRLFTGSDEFAGPGTGSVVVEIKPGSSLSQIGEVLVQADVVRSSDAFVTAAGDTTIQPGSYKLKHEMTSVGALALLQSSAARVSAKVTIREGLRLSAIVAELSRVTKIPVKNFAAALAKPTSLGLPAEAGGKAEGLLFPATYDVEPGESATELLTRMVDRFQQASVTLDVEHRAKAVHLSPYQVLIVASIVEAEGKPDTYAKIARVVENRLAQGKNLELDTTVLYALRRFTPPPSAVDLTLKSPYNTYVVGGLPPGPIDSPGEAALTAVLEPAAGNWIYYVTVNPKTGETKFTSSYSEFLQFKAQLKANGG